MRMKPSRGKQWIGSGGREVLTDTIDISILRDSCVGEAE